MSEDGFQDEWNLEREKKLWVKKRKRGNRERKEREKNLTSREWFFFFPITSSHLLTQIIWKWDRENSRERRERINSLLSATLAMEREKREREEKKKRGREKFSFTEWKSSLKCIKLCLFPLFQQLLLFLSFLCRRGFDWGRIGRESERELEWRRKRERVLGKKRFSIFMLFCSVELTLERVKVTTSLSFLFHLLISFSEFEPVEKNVIGKHSSKIDTSRFSWQTKSVREKEKERNREWAEERKRERERKRKTKWKENIPKKPVKSNWKNLWKIRD